jgi:hypothetical protein
MNVDEFEEEAADDQIIKPELHINIPMVKQTNLNSIVFSNGKQID